MDNLVIRKMEYKDIESVANIKVSSWRLSYKGIIDDEYLDNMDINSYIEKRREDYNKSLYYVAELDGKVVGFSRYDDRLRQVNGKNIGGEIYALYVDPNMKRMGIGRALVNKIEEEFKEKGITSFIIWCLKDNEPSKIFYRKIGGVEFSEKEIEIGGINYMETGFLYNMEEK